MRDTFVTPQVGQAWELLGAEAVVEMLKCVETGTVRSVMKLCIQINAHSHLYRKAPSTMMPVEVALPEDEARVTRDEHLFEKLECV
eukprot:2031212-Pyramimonas_sp.AAC.2